MIEMAYVAWESETCKRVPDLPLLSSSDGGNGKIHYLLRNKRDRFKHRNHQSTKHDVEDIEDDSWGSSDPSSAPQSRQPTVTWSSEDVEEAHKLLYSAVVRNSLRFADKLLDEPYVDINVYRFGENLLMTAIRHEQVEMARFLIENGINFNATRTLLERKSKKDSSSDILNWYTINCRQLAYEKGLFEVVHLIDYLNGELYPFVRQPEFNPKLREPRLGMFSSVVSIPEALYDESKPSRSVSTVSFLRQSATDSSRTYSTLSSQENKFSSVRFNVNRPKTAHEDSFFAPLGPADIASLSGARSNLMNRITPVLGGRTLNTQSNIRSVSRSTNPVSLRSRASPSSSNGGSWVAPIRETKSSVLRKANISVSSHDLPLISKRKKNHRMGLSDALLGACIG